MIAPRFRSFLGHFRELERQCCVRVPALGLDRSRVAEGGVRAVNGVHSLGREWLDVGPGGIVGDDRLPRAIRVAHDVVSPTSKTDESALLHEGPKVRTSIFHRMKFRIEALQKNDKIGKCKIRQLLG